jgi:hypothetical protein
VIILSIGLCRCHNSSWQDMPGAPEIYSISWDSSVAKPMSMADPLTSRPDSPEWKANHEAI